MLRMHEENSEILNETQWRQNQGAIRSVRSFIARTEEAHDVLNALKGKQA